MKLELGTDVRILEGEYLNDARGDIQTITGIENLKEAIYRRIITPTGQILHRQTYGVGIYSFMNKPSTPSNQQELSNKIKMNIINEKRIETVNSITCDWNQDIVYVNIKLTAYGTLIEMDFEVVNTV